MVFESLFGDGGSAQERQAALKERASLLDAFRQDVARLKRDLGAADRARMDDYLETIREVERRIQQAEASVEIIRCRTWTDHRRAGRLCGPCPSHVRSSVSGLSGDVTRG